MVLVASALVACFYLCMAVWFVVHQREYQYTGGGTSGSPEAAGLEGFAEFSISTEDGEHIVAWWAAPPDGAGVVLFSHGTRRHRWIPSGVCRILGIAGSA